MQHHGPTKGNRLSQKEVIAALALRGLCPGDEEADCWDGKATRYDLKSHASDCARHNMPAMPNGPCNCGVWPTCPVCNGEARTGGGYYSHLTNEWISPSPCDDMPDDREAYYNERAEKMP